MFGIPCCYMEVIQFLLGILLVIFLVTCAFVKLTTQPLAQIHTFPQEKHFKTGSSKSVHTTSQSFPSIDEAATVNLSVIVPAYNEQERLPKMLDECLSYLDSCGKKYEVIIVDDGSKDCTTSVALDYTEKFSSDKVRVLTLAHNRGKGGAVRMGILKARGEALLFADADGATTFEELSKLEIELERIASDGQGIVCGSRAHLQDESIASRSGFRTLLMYGFHFCVWLFAVKNVRDTQCGFKLLTRQSARVIFKSLHIERWAFDVEMLKIAEMLSIPVSEIPVRWTEIDGSKLNPVLAAVQMFRDIFLLWLRYAIGAWKIVNKRE